MYSDNGKNIVTVKRLRRRMTVFFTLIMLAVFTAVSVFTVSLINKNIRKETSAHITSGGIGLMTSVNYYISTTEHDCGDVFRNETVVSYDPIENSYADHETAQLYNDAKTQLLELSAGDAYNDFLILFSDGSAVGKVSSGITDILGSVDFSYFTDILGGESDVWICGLSGNYSKIYYIREMTDHSLFLLSFYAEELDCVISSSQLNEYYIVADRNGKVIFSNDNNAAVGKPIPSEYNELYADNENTYSITDDYVSASLTLDNGWQIILFTDSPALFDINIKNISIILALAAAFTLISVLTGILATAKYASSDIVKVSGEFIDPLTGILNDYGLDENISELLETSVVGSIYAFIILGVRDSAQIKSTLSPRYWNSIRLKLIEQTDKYFSGRKNYIGRTEDDRIIVFADYSEFNIFKAHEDLRNGCSEFISSLEDFTVGDNALKLGISVGVSIYPDHGDDYESLYQKASEAFNKAEENSGGKCEIYDPERYKRSEKGGGAS